MAGELLAPRFMAVAVLRMQEEAVLTQIDPDQRDGTHADLPKRKQLDQRKPIGLFRSG
ncbi:MAG TPA: hypothetical protein VJS30_30425 [Paraburkholderia sp.]|nr:hypothetical protein [Paraburkholderia sp.]